jgi:sugar phosphate isomerase/epimerase
MNIQPRIKLGVTLYSLQDEYVWGKLSLEDCLAALQKMGAEGVELLGDQMIPNSPFPEESFYQTWHGWLQKYQLKPVCDDIFINMTLYRNRRLTTKEAIAALKAEISHAHKMGFEIMRLLVSKTPNEIVLPCLEFAEKHNMQMALEIHAGGSTLTSPLSQEFVEIMTRANSPYIGLVFDMGLFCRKFPRVILDYYRREGVAPVLLDFVDDVFKSGTDLRSVPDSDLEKYRRASIDAEFWKYAHSFENNPVDLMRPYLNYVRNCHGKFFEMMDEGIEYSIPYDQIIAYFQANGYDGFICSEYEGNRFVPAGVEVKGVDQLTRHHKMMRAYLQAEKVS